jgi:hypothetical protein
MVRHIQIMTDNRWPKQVLQEERREKIGRQMGERNVSFNFRGLEEGKWTNREEW